MATSASERRLSSSQAGRILGVSSQQVRRWIHAGQLPADETPLGYLVRLSDIESLQREREARHAVRAS